MNEIMDLLLKNKHTFEVDSTADMFRFKIPIEDM